MLFLFAHRCLRRLSPLVDPGLLRLPEVLPSHAVALIVNVVMCSLLFFLAIELELVIGLSALTAGAALVPLAAALVIASPIVGRITDRRSTRSTVVLGATLLGSSQAGLALLVDRGSLALVIGRTVTTGVAMAWRPPGARVAGNPGRALRRPRDQRGLAAGAAVIAWFWLPRHRASPEQQSTFTRSSDQDTKLQVTNPLKEPT